MKCALNPIEICISLDLSSMDTSTQFFQSKRIIRTHLYQASASTLWQCCNDACDSVLIENSGVAWKWVANPIWSDSMFSMGITNVIAALMLTLSINGPLRLVHTNRPHHHHCNVDRQHHWFLMLTVVDRMGCIPILPVTLYDNVDGVAWCEWAFTAWLYRRLTHRGIFPQVVSRPHHHDDSKTGKPRDISSSNVTVYCRLCRGRTARRLRGPSPRPTRARPVSPARRTTRRRTSRRLNPNQR